MHPGNRANYSEASYASQVISIPRCNTCSQDAAFARAKVRWDFSIARRAWFAPLHNDKPFHLLFTEKAVVIGMVHVLLPFMILTLTATMAQIDHSLVLAAQTLGASPARAFLKVYLPLSMPGVASGSMLVFIMGLGYYITPALLGGPRQIMFANLIDRFVNQTFQWGVAAAAAVLLLVISTVLYVVSRRFGRVEGLFGG